MVRIAQGVISGSQPPSGYTFLNQQVNITVLNPDGTELTATAANPIRLAFTIDGSLLLPGENENTIQIFRNGVLIPNCLGQRSIPAANLDPCVTAREDSTVCPVQRTRIRHAECRNSRSRGLRLASDMDSVNYRDCNAQLHRREQSALRAFCVGVPGQPLQERAA